MNRRRVHVSVSGLVQGVGFRHTTYRRATALGLGGWVRNLPDGRVEAEFEGDEDALETMLAWCRSGPALSQVDAVDTRWQAALHPAGPFEIRF